MVKVDLPPEPRSATRARQLTREQLAASCPEEAVEVAALLVTELVSNAILHARTDIVLIVDVVRPGTVPECIVGGEPQDRDVVPVPAGRVEGGWIGDNTQPVERFKRGHADPPGRRTVSG